jgi:hypothetical protein
MFASLNTWIISLHSNEAQLLGVIIGTLTTVFVAYFGIKAAFSQITKQFENKVIYEGWNNFQDKIFGFSTSFTDYSSSIQWLTYFIKSQNNPLVNAGDLSKYRSNKWNEINKEYENLTQGYIKFLQSYETHEIIFLSLKNMYTEFIKEWRKRIENNHMKLIEEIFPEFYGKEQTFNDNELTKKINNYWYKTTEMSAFLDDFRRELQNVTLGKILSKSIPRRTPPEEKYKILTTKGFVFSGSRLKKFIKELKHNLKKL